MILPAQSIRQACLGLPLDRRGVALCPPLVSPFCERTVHEETGATYGLGPAGYDVRVAQDLELRPGDFVLASTIEKVCLGNDVMVFVKDKSSWARRGIAVQNTVLEPGWRGHTTLEISYHDYGGRRLFIRAGTPIAQFVFCVLTSPTQQPYEGRYQDQGPDPVAAILRA